MQENDDDKNILTEAILKILVDSDIPKGKFTSECIESLTLALSEIIKAGYCPCHWNDGFEKAIELIKEDLSDKNDHLWGNDCKIIEEKND